MIYLMDLDNYILMIKIFYEGYRIKGKKEGEFKLLGENEIFLRKLI